MRNWTKSIQAYYPPRPSHHSRSNTDYDGNSSLKILKIHKTLGVMLASRKSSFGELLNSVQQAKKINMAT